jgi:predicted anti-sigma-YlaC factor YlaD
MSSVPSDDLACKELVELITDYLEEAISDQDRTRFEEHLVMCGGCREYLRQMRSVIGLSRKLSEEALPESVKDELLTIFRRWKSGS